MTVDTNSLRRSSKNCDMQFGNNDIQTNILTYRFKDMVKMVKVKRKKGEE